MTVIALLPEKKRHSLARGDPTLGPAALTYRTWSNLYT